MMSDLAINMLIVGASVVMVVVIFSGIAGLMFYGIRCLINLVG